MPFGLKHKQQRKKNLILTLILVLFIAIVYYMTIVKMS